MLLHMHCLCDTKVNANRLQLIAPDNSTQGPYGKTTFFPNLRFSFSFLSFFFLAHLQCAFRTHSFFPHYHQDHFFSDECQTYVR